MLTVLLFSCELFLHYFGIHFLLYLYSNCLDLNGSSKDFNVEKYVLWKVFTIWLTGEWLQARAQYWVNKITPNYMAHCIVCAIYPSAKDVLTFVAFLHRKHLFIIFGQDWVFSIQSLNKTKNHYESIVHVSKPKSKCFLLQKQFVRHSWSFLFQVLTLSAVYALL